MGWGGVSMDRSGLSGDMSVYVYIYYIKTYDIFWILDLISIFLIVYAGET